MGVLGKSKSKGKTTSTKAKEKFTQSPKADKPKNNKVKIFTIIGGCLFVAVLGVGLFFIFNNNSKANNTFQITQATNISSETQTIVEQKGNQVTLTAKSVEGYRFICWQAGSQNVSSEQVYTFTINENTNLTYTAIYAKEYAVFIDTGIQNGSVVADKFIVIAGEEVVLTVIPDSTYKLKSLRCKQGEIDIAINNNKFIMPEGNVFIDAEFEKVDFLIKFPRTRIGYTITNIDDTEFNIASVKANESISFKIKLDVEYMQSEYVVRHNGVVITAVNDIYTIENITDNVNITIDGIGGINTYAVSFPQTRTGYTITNIDNSEFDETITIEYSGSMSFKIKLDDSYSQCVNDIIVRNNGVVIALENGIYKIDNITDDVNITIEGVSINKYQIKVPATQTGYSIINVDNSEFNTTSVDYNGSLMFKIKLDNGYSQCINDIVVKNNGVNIVAENGIYSLNNITEEVNLTIDGVKINTYQITLPTTQIGYTITNTDNLEFDILSVDYNGSISFKISLDNEYSQCANNIIVSSNGIVILAQDGIYTITNITENINITIEGVLINKYQVKVPTTQTGYSIKTLANTVFATTDVESGSLVQFRVVLDAEYSQSTVVVKSNGMVLEADDGIYTITNVIENITITVSGVQLNSYTITFPESVIVTKNGVRLASGDKVYHYDKILLEAIPSDGYSAVFGVSGATLISGNNYRVVGAVNISYSEQEIVPVDVSDCPTLVFDYDNENHTASVSVNTSQMPTGDVVIPEKIKNGDEVYFVTEIKSNAFEDCVNLKTISIPRTVVDIKANAFLRCTRLTTVMFEGNSKLSSIGNYAFSDCSSLSYISIPSSVASLGDEIFSECGDSIFNTYGNASYIGNTQNPYLILYKLNNSEITSCTINSNCKLIGCYAFEECTKLSSITIPSSVKIIEKGAFSVCTALQSVSFEENSQLTRIENYAFCDCEALRSITIPSGVTNIGTGAFASDSALNKVVVDDVKDWLNIQFGNMSANPLCNGGYLYVGDNKITQIEVPNDISKINQYAFSGYTYLTAVNFSNGITSIDKYAFYNTAIESIVIPSCVMQIAMSAFQNCLSLSSVVLSNGIQGIGHYAFSGCNKLASITIPNTITSIGNYAFQNCAKLENLLFEQNSQINSIGNYAFDNCSLLSSVVIPDSLVAIGYYAFRNCSSLASVDISVNSQLIDIRHHAFYNCVLLSSIVIPQYVGSTEEIVGSIGANAFNGCNITDVSIYSSYVYNAAITTKISGYLLSNATTIKVLASIVNDVNNSNVFLNNEQNYNKVLTNIDGVDFYVYTKIENN